jgi:hypothetical protein
MDSVHDKVNAKSKFLKALKEALPTPAGATPTTAMGAQPAAGQQPQMDPKALQAQVMADKANKAKATADQQVIKAMQAYHQNEIEKLKKGILPAQTTGTGTGTGTPAAH